MECNGSWGATAETVLVLKGAERSQFDTMDPFLLAALFRNVLQSNEHRSRMVDPNLKHTLNAWL